MADAHATTDAQNQFMFLIGFDELFYQRKDGSLAAIDNTFATDHDHVCIGKNSNRAFCSRSIDYLAGDQRLAHEARLQVFSAERCGLSHILTPSLDSRLRIK